MISAPDPMRVVSVVVPVFNDPRLPYCLDALARQRMPAGWRVETVVVDNGSDEPVASAGSLWPEVTFALETRRGSYAARNTGLTFTTGEVIAFTDSDCTPDPDWLLVTLTRFINDDALAALAGRVRTVFPTGGPSTGPGWWERIEAFPQKRYVANGYGVTANLIVRREAGNAVGWFDANFLSGGDADFGQRLTGSGRTLAYEDDAVVSHPARTTWRELFAKGRRTAQGRARLEHLRRRGALGVLISVYSTVVQLGKVLQRSVTDEDLVGLSGRMKYLAAGVALRVFWFVELCRWRIHYYRRDARRPSTPAAGAER